MTEPTDTFAQRPRFHLAFPVDDLEAARVFYGEVLGCREGRSSDSWIDFDLYGHQIVAHYVGNRSKSVHNPVDGDQVPVPHFGLLLRPADWQTLADRMKAANVKFVIEPHTRFVGKVGEHSTMFVFDPAGNALEFKAFADEGQIFATT
mgnify:CR=1 FL=1